MKISFKTIFVMISAIVAGYALHDYQKSDLREAQKANQYLVLPSVSYEDVKQIRILRPMGELVLINTYIEGSADKKVWRLEKPLVDEADRQTVVNFFTSLSNLYLKPAGIEGDIKWAEYGLAQPESQLEINYVEEGIEKTLKLEFGSVRSVENGYYVRKNGTNELFVSSADWTPQLLIIPAELRNKSVFKLEAPLSEVEMREKHNSWNLVFNDSKWSLKPESGEPVTPTDESVQDLAKSLHSFKADRILDSSTQKTAPLFTLKVKTATPPTEQTVSFYEKGTTVHAVTPGRPVVFEINKEMLASIYKKTAYFMNKPESSNDKGE